MLPSSGRSQDLPDQNSCIVVSFQNFRCFSRISSDVNSGRPGGGQSRCSVLTAIPSFSQAGKDRCCTMQCVSSCAMVGSIAEISDSTKTKCPYPCCRNMPPDSAYSPPLE